MSSRVAGFCLVLVFAAIAAPAYAQQGAAPPPGGEERFGTVDRSRASAPASDYDRFRATARRRGTVRVIAGLKIAFTPEGALAAGRRGAQRRAIDDATAAVRRALQGTSHRVVHTYETVPYIALELSEAALTRLEAAEAAATLQEDASADPRWRRARRSSRPQSPLQSVALGAAGWSRSSTRASRSPTPSSSTGRRIQGALRGVLLRRRRLPRKRRRRARPPAQG